jgi:hypothetical protein
LGEAPESKAFGLIESFAFRLIESFAFRLIESFAFRLINAPLLDVAFERSKGYAK